jgi:Na+/H+ antiporter NhaD/arsenite permease-like protein
MGIPAIFAAGLAVPPATAVPFLLLLAAIAVLPLTSGHWWHKNRNKAILAALIIVPVLVLMLMNPGGDAAIVHGLEEYVQFIALVGSLYVIAGGIALTGDLEGTPRVNAAFLAGGAVLANVIGTTGASMLLIRPLMKTNSEREHIRHIPVFFILIVSNCGGLLTPLGDPPLFLGFLAGVDFWWNLQLAPQWAFVNACLLIQFVIWDTIAHRRETAKALRSDETRIHPLRLYGWKVNVPLMLGVIAAVILKKYVATPMLCEAVMVLCAGLSVALTPRSVRDANEFSWGPVLEVAILFLAIFISMVPVMALLREHGKSIPVTHAWQFFWLTGVFSSMLDNAPTYMAMGQLAATVQGLEGIRELSLARADLLAAVSCGAVFMGANSYIGNGPNFMVKAIVEEAGKPMPSFFGYVALAAAITVPVYLATTLLFFRG